MKLLEFVVFLMLALKQKQFQNRTMLNLKVNIFIAKNILMLRQVDKETSRFDNVVVYLVKKILKSTQEGHQAALLLMAIIESRLYFLNKFSVFQLYKKLFPTV